MIENLVEDIGRSLGDWAYVLVAIIAMAETAAFLGFIAPGEFTVIFGGVLAGEGTLSIWILIAVVWAAAVAGDSVGFLLGRRLGRDFALAHGHRLRLTQDRFRQVEDYFERHGGKTVFIGRWFGFIRPLVPFTAGATRVPYQRFITYDILAAGLWTAVSVLIGFVFWRSFESITEALGQGSLVFGTLVAIAVGVVFAFKKLRRAEQRRRLAAWFTRQGKRPLLRPLAFVVGALWVVLLRPLWRWLLRPIGRVSAPPLRFAWGRLTPGELGIELTTLLALAAVAGYIFALNTSLVHDYVLLPFDGTALDLARDIESSALTTVAEGITALGIFPIAALAVIAGLVVLLVRRQVADCFVLAVGFVASNVGVLIAKAAVDRARPVDPLVDADEASFPSGHATAAIAYVALAVIFARTARRSAVRVGLVVGAVVIALLVGLSRVYLRVHYLSDVASGWELALAVFSLAGAVALIVEYLRNNGDSAETEQPKREDG